jgi:hypothetical protein
LSEDASSPGRTVRIPERSVVIDECDRVISVKDSESDYWWDGLEYLADFENLSVDCGYAKPLPMMSIAA